MDTLTGFIPSKSASSGLYILCCWSLLRGLVLALCQLHWVFFFLGFTHTYRLSSSPHYSAFSTEDNQGVRESGAKLVCVWLCKTKKNCLIKKAALKLIRIVRWMWENNSILHGQKNTSEFGVIENTYWKILSRKVM